MNEDKQANPPVDSEATLPDGPDQGRPDLASSGETVREKVAGPPAELHAYIGRQLRAVYDDVAKQPVPERFLDLMRKLETQGG